MARTLTIFLKVYLCVLTIYLAAYLYTSGMALLERMRETPLCISGGPEPARPICLWGRQ